MVGLRWRWCEEKWRRARRCTRDGKEASARCRSPDKKKARLVSRASSIRAGEEVYFFFGVVFDALAMLSRIMLSLAIESFIAVESIIFMPVSMAAGAGAIAAPVSTGVSSFLLHAARTRTAATRAMRFIEKSP